MKNNFLKRIVSVALATLTICSVLVVSVLSTQAASSSKELPEIRSDSAVSGSTTQETSPNMQLAVGDNTILSKYSGTMTY